MPAISIPLTQNANMGATTIFPRQLHKRISRIRLAMGLEGLVPSIFRLLLEAIGWSSIPRGN